MTQETKEAIVNLGEKLRVVTLAPTVVTFEPERPVATMAVGTARLDSNLTRQIETGDPELEQELDESLRDFSTAYCQKVMNSRIPGRDSASDEQEVDVHEAKLRKKIKTMFKNGYGLEQLQDRADELIKESSAGETHMGITSRLNREVANAAKTLIVDVYTEPTED